MFGPPELVHVDWKDTDAPGLILQDYGKGGVAWLPWDIGSLYYRHSSEAHAGLLRDLIDHLLPHGRQLKTNAHPLVEIVLMQAEPTVAFCISSTSQATRRRPTSMPCPCAKSMCRWRAPTAARGSSAPQRACPSGKTAATRNSRCLLWRNMNLSSFGSRCARYTGCPANSPGPTPVWDRSSSCPTGVASWLPR